MPEREYAVRAIPLRITTNGWTVYWENRDAAGSIGWGLSAAEAAILAIRIELGEVEV